jgi:hypothetical protein
VGGAPEAAPAPAAKMELKTALLVGNPLFDLSLNDQAAAERKLAVDEANGGWIASAGPDAADRARAPALSSAPDTALALTHLAASSRSRDLVAGQKLPPLPGTGAEVAAIAELMQADGWKTELFTGQLALKRVVEEARSPRVLHIATHGFFLPDQQVAASGPGSAAGAGDSGGFSGSDFEDPMRRSGLYFAGANRTLAGDAATQPGDTSAGEGVASVAANVSPRAAHTATAGGANNGLNNAQEKNFDDGVLTALEAGSLDLTGTELVVLSACNTGQGETKNGEGVLGLRRALEEAGAQSVIMSLWSVPDKETLELMKLFYQKWLSGMEKHEALKQAQLEMRQRVRSEHDGRDLPYYWAAFVLVGN